MNIRSMCRKEIHYIKIERNTKKISDLTDRRNHCLSSTNRLVLTVQSGRGVYETFRVIDN